MAEHHPIDVYNKTGAQIRIVDNEGQEVIHDPWTGAGGIMEDGSFFRLKGGKVELQIFRSPTNQIELRLMPAGSDGDSGGGGGGLAVDPDGGGYE